MSDRVLLYGATGFSGRALAAALADLGDRLVLGGRDATKLAMVAANLGLGYRVFCLTPDRGVDMALADIGVVLNCAGPFVETAGPMMSACLRTGTDYLDISGEWPSFADALSRNDAAVRTGVMLLPGVGFTIVASDCLLAMAAEQYPGTAKLRLGVSRPPRISRGSVEAILGLNDVDIRVRRKGVVVPLPAGHLTGQFDFGDDDEGAVAVTWPDVITGQFTTGVANIETYAQGGWIARTAIRLGAAVADLATGTTDRALIRAVGGFWPVVPPPPEPDRPGFVLVAEALDPWRRASTLRMATDDGYAVTTATAAAAIRLWRDGIRRPGFMTPATLYGSRFILECGCAAMMPAAP